MRHRARSAHGTRPAPASSACEPLASVAGRNSILMSADPKKEARAIYARACLAVVLLLDVVVHNRFNIRPGAEILSYRIQDVVVVAGSLLQWNPVIKLNRLTQQLLGDL